MFEVELPGVGIEEDVTIEVVDDVLEIEGETEHDNEYDREGFHMTERRFGSFLRRFPLPDGVDAEVVTAADHAGVLTVRVPLPEETAPTEPRKITIEHD